ncbi:MAG: helix-turn-helix domain-containing protein [Proteobacteria bacterium]|nr:helix-turn-helix domain-containing protein [Pseudomonadota bacterium]
MNRASLPDWPRLMTIEMAAAYLSRSESTIKDRGPTPKRDGRSVLYDRKDLDRWADRLGGQPLTEVEESAEAKEVERRFLEKMNGGH